MTIKNARFSLPGDPAGTFRQADDNRLRSADGQYFNDQSAPQVELTSEPLTGAAAAEAAGIFVGTTVIFRESGDGPAEPGVVIEKASADDDHPNAGEYRIALDGGGEVLAYWTELHPVEDQATVDAVNTPATNSNSDWDGIAPGEESVYERFPGNTFDYIAVSKTDDGSGSFEENGSELVVTAGLGAVDFGPLVEGVGGIDSPFGFNHYQITFLMENANTIDEWIRENYGDIRLNGAPGQVMEDPANAGLMTQVTAEDLPDGIPDTINELHDVLKENTKFPQLHADLDSGEFHTRLRAHLVEKARADFGPRRSGNIVKRDGTAGEVTYGTAVTFISDTGEKLTEGMQIRTTGGGRPVIVVTPASPGGVVVDQPSRFGAKVDEEWVRRFAEDNPLV